MTVRVLQDFGEITLESGDTVILTKNSRVNSSRSSSRCLSVFLSRAHINFGFVSCVCVCVAASHTRALTLALIVSILFAEWMWRS